MSATLQQHVEAMVMMIAADGEYQESERQTALKLLAKHPAAQGLSEAEVDDLFARGAEAVLNEGVDVRLTKLAQAATARDERLEILRSAILICVADGEVAVEEMTLLRKIMNALTLTEADLNAQIDGMMKPSS